MAESSPYDTVAGLCLGCNPPAHAAANRQLPMAGHGSTTQTRINALLLPPTPRHVIETKSPPPTKEKKKHTCNAPLPPQKKEVGHFRTAALIGVKMPL